MEYFGIAGFILACVAWGKVKKLERVLRENGIGSAGSRDLGRHLAEMVGQRVALSFHDDMLESSIPCLVLDADEAWALLLFKEGKKNEYKKLVRLEDVKEIKIEK